MSDPKAYQPSEKVVHALESVGAALAVSNARDRGFLIAGLRRLLGVGVAQTSTSTEKASKKPDKDPNSLRTLERESDEFKARAAHLEKIKEEARKLGVQKLDPSHDLVKELKKLDEALTKKREELRKAAGQRTAQQNANPGPVTRARAKAKAAVPPAVKAPQAVGSSSRNASPKSTSSSSGKRAF